jgi:cytosine/adenosine deaminase-related metal-dependent hydrolase
MSYSSLFKKVHSSLETTPLPYENDEHSRHRSKNFPHRKILIHNAGFIFTCDEQDRIICHKNHSIVIEDNIIKDVLPAKKLAPYLKQFDLVYDAGKRGGTVITPGLINTHSHIHMYLLRSAMILDEEETVDQTIAAMAIWQKNESEDAYAFASVGDLTEQQKSGITTTLTHGPSFESADIAAKVCGHNLICAVSAVSNSKPANSPEMVKKILAEKNSYYSTPAVSLHYLYKTPAETLKKIKNIVDEYGTLVTFHMAESPHVVKQTKNNHQTGETGVLKKFGLLNRHSLASHVLYVTPKEIEQIAVNGMGIAHLPTSNVIHQSGLFQFWPFAEAGAFPTIALGTDSVVSKNRLDLLTEAYQARITHLYSKTIKFGSLFKMMTANGARVLNLPDRGKILPGMKADLVCWKLRDRGFIPYDTNNPYTLLGNLITHGGRLVRDTMINGQFVIRDRRHQLVNETELLNIMQQKHTRMRRRVQKENPDLIKKKIMAKPA